MAVMLVSCTGNSGDGGSDENGGSITSKELTVSADKKFVQTFGGDYVTLQVTLDGQPVTEGVTFFDASDNVIEVEDFKFMTEVAGTHKISAAYGTYFSKPVTVTAIAVAIPAVSEDEHPERTDFKQKVLVTQFTTTGCSACPPMKKHLKNALTGNYVDKVVKVDCHNGTINKRNDPAYVHLPDFGSGSFPTVLFDLYTKGDNANIQSTSDVHAMIDGRYEYKDGIAAGIAVASEAAEGQIVTKVVVKAAKEAQYKVGVMLLEDNIVATSSQSQMGTGVEEWMNTHNSCVRYMDAGPKYDGHSLGTIKVGETADYVFVFNLDDIWDDGILKAEQNYSTWADTWVAEELHLAVFVTTTTEDGYDIYVSNVVDCPIDDSIAFQYR